ncbi:A33 protein, partial [Crypturellus soui]|nr:A33 protein [Crypturellus soui]
NEMCWAVGVANAFFLNRKARIFPCPKEWIWAVRQKKGKFEALTDPRTPLSLSPVPKRILVVLDCSLGKVIFFNAENGAEIY